MAYQAARISQSMKLYKTEDPPSWCNEKIKLAFSFGNGTEKDFKRYCKDNKCIIVSENEFYKELYSLPLNEQETHIQFIREQLNRYNNL